MADLPQNPQANSTPAESFPAHVNSPRVYLDNAATTWPKSTAALAAAWDFMHGNGATAGRGAYASARSAEEWVARARAEIGRVLGPSGSGVAFCHNGTHALNAALHGVLQPGQHVLTTALEHNSLLRPLKQLEAELGLSFDVIPVDQAGRAQLAAAEKLVRPDTSWLLLGHASNVTGAVNSLELWSEFAATHQLGFVLDASQTLGYLPVDVQLARVDLLAAAGHKGLRAMPGTGFLYVAPPWRDTFKPLLAGGTGNASESIQSSPPWPLSIEVGNLNLPGIVSLAVAASELPSPDQAAATSPAWWAPYRDLALGLRELVGLQLLGFNESELPLPETPAAAQIS